MSLYTQCYLCIFPTHKDTKAKTENLNGLKNVAQYCLNAFKLYKFKRTCVGGLVGFHTHNTTPIALVFPSTFSLI